MIVMEWLCPILGILGFVGLIFLPALIGRIVDPRAARIITQHCLDQGYTDVKVTPYPNHYGVRMSKGGKRLYGRCLVVGREVQWKGKGPAPRKRKHGP